jgi:hypothetical protein
MTFKVTFNTNLEAKARRASQEAAKAVFMELNGRFQDALGTKAWAWPRATLRSNNRVISAGLRNIVDSANLKGSNPGPRISGLQSVYRWNTPYARFVHEGGMMYPYGDKSRTPMALPMRPWTAAVLGTIPYSGIPIYPLSSRYADVWLAKFRGL